jgi:hypothetical protein
MPQDAPPNGSARVPAPEGPRSRVAGMQAKLHRWAAADPGDRMIVMLLSDAPGRRARDTWAQRLLRDGGRGGPDAWRYGEHLSRRYPVADTVR